MSTTYNFGIQLWAEGDTQPQNKYNSLATSFDFWTGRGVKSKTTTAQPGSPTEGDAYIIPAGKTGAQWGTFAVDSIALFIDATWYEFVPVARVRVYIDDQGLDWFWSGSAWVDPYASGGFIKTADMDTMSELNGIVSDGPIATEAYVNNAVTGLLDFKGGYNASTNTPDLDTSPSGVKVGDTYTVTVAGTFFTQAVNPGDMLVSEIDNPTVLTDWTLVVRPVDPGANIIYETGTTHTIVAIENGALIVCNNASPIAVTLPDSLPVGFQFSVVWVGAGMPTTTPSGSDLVNGASAGIAPANQWEGKFFSKYVAGNWLCMG